MKDCPGILKLKIYKKTDHILNNTAFFNKLQHNVDALPSLCTELDERLIWSA